MSRLRKIAQIPGRELGQVGGRGLLGAHARHLVPAVSKAKVTAAGTLRCRRSCSKASRSGSCGQPVRGRQVGCAGIGTSGRAGSTPWRAGKAPARTAATLNAG